MDKIGKSAYEKLPEHMALLPHARMRKLCRRRPFSLVFRIEDKKALLEKRCLRLETPLCIEHEASAGKELRPIAADRVGAGKPAADLFCILCKAVLRKRERKRRVGISGNIAILRKVEQDIEREVVVAVVVEIVVGEGDADMRAVELELGKIRCRHAACLGKLPRAGKRAHRCRHGTHTQRNKLPIVYQEGFGGKTGAGSCHDRHDRSTGYIVGQTA